MSRDPRNHEPGDANLERLLTMADAPPQLGSEARARLLGRLQRSVTDLKKTPAAASGGPLLMSPRSRLSLAKLTAYALSLAACGALVWSGVRFFTQGPGDDSAVSPDSFALHRNDGARPQLVTLADGSTVILRAGAAVQQHGARRLELLSGEVLLDVKPGEVAFKITAGAGDVEVRGTKFVLRQSPERGALEAGVLRGEVRLFNGAGEAILQAGEAGVLAPGAAPARRDAERLSHEVAWARDALTDPTDELAVVRRGNLLARFPNWEGREWPLPVRVMDVDVYVENGVARTTIDQTFFNHTDYELEGVYSFPLPADAAIARLAMYVDGKLMEAGVTERQEGREIYESIVYRRRDPALLEWMQGNQFRVRIFPLPARTEKRIFLSYTQPLASLYGDYSVRVPIPEYDVPALTLRYRVHIKDKSLAIDSCCVDFAVTDTGDEKLAEATIRGASVGEDLALTLYPTQKPAEASLAVQRDPGGDYVMVRARPDLPRSSMHTPRRWVVLHDTSASRSPAELAAQTRFLRHLLSELDEADRLALVAFDSTLRSLPGGFSRVDGLDLQAVDQFLAREGRDHVGATELGKAVDHALALFAEDGGAEAPHILYLGDGLISDRSDAGRAGIRERLAGEATFVAAAVGDEVDATLLADLAGASGGLHVQLTPGGDLKWQALDLAAALNTARLQDVRATLMAGDAPFTGRTHLSADSLSDGEAVVMLSRRTGPSGQAPTALLLEGTLAGAPWSQRYTLPAPDEAGAGYVPKLWARAQVEADVRAGADEHRSEITALGLEHFLVTPFTSLLVLENEAMYRQYKVTRPTARDWAHYEAPAEIQVVREKVGLREPTPGTLVQRQPISLVTSNGYHPLLGWNQQDRWSGADDGVAGIGGLGLIGVGVGGGSGDGAIGLGSTGLIGFGGGGGTGSGYGRGAGAGFGGRGTRVPTVRMGQVEVGESEPAKAATTQFVTTSDLAKSTEFSRKVTPDVASAGPTRSRGFGGGLFGGEARQQSIYRGGGHTSGFPSALHNLGDTRLGDLGEHVPALFEDAFDRERERLLGDTAAISSGTMTDDARRLLTDARARTRTAAYKLNGAVVRVEDGGAFTRTRDIGGYLEEVVRYDGATLTATYPGLELSVIRRVDAAEPTLLAQWVPWLLPSPDALARWYDVTLTGARTLRLALRGAEDVIELELDAELRLAAVRHRRGAQDVGTMNFNYDAAGLTIAQGARKVRVDVTDAAPVTAKTAETTLQLPLRGDVELSAALAETTPGAPAWRDLQRQRLAVLAALAQHNRLAGVLAEIHAHGPLTRGELVLGGAGLLTTDDATASRLIKNFKEDPVAAYLAALRKARKNQLGELDRVAKTNDGTLVGMLATHGILIEAGRKNGSSAANLTRLREFLKTYDNSELAYVATHRIAGAYDWRRPQVGAPAWEALAEAQPSLRATALHAAGLAFVYAGKYVEAADRFERALAAAIEFKQVPTIDWQLRSAIQRARGEAGWRLTWNRWRADVQKSNDGEQMLAFLNAAQQFGEASDIHRVLVGADVTQLDPAAGAGLVLALLNSGQVSDAQAVLRGLLIKNPEAAGTLDLAGRVAERQGRLEEAAAFASRALAAAGDLPLAQLRGAYRRLFDLRARLAESIVMPGADVVQGRGPLDAALDVAARWRAEDPGNADIDALCATLLFTLGQPDEALRHLDSIIERQPAEGQAYATVAVRLEQEGRFAEADARLQQAIAVEPTNPTWLLSRAQNLLVSGDFATARALARQIKDGDWQDRFSGVEYQARDLLTQLDALKK